MAAATVRGADRELTGSGSTAACTGATGATAIGSAAHPHELPPSDRVHVYLDAAQHGLGSRSCGMDVLPRYALWPGSFSFTVAIRTE